MKSEYVYKIKGDLRRNEKMEDGRWRVNIYTKYEEIRCKVSLPFFLRYNF